MSIVRVRNKKTGKIYLYEATYVTDENGQKKQKRTYLGIEDPETGKLIPSSKKPGRKPGGNSAPRRKVQVNAEPEQQITNEDLDKLEVELKALQEQRKLLERQVEAHRALFKQIAEMLDGLVGTLK